MDEEFPSSSDDENFAERKTSETSKKSAKKRKKKPLSEPQKPASAYALFFRDTQAAIKAENAMATFGEVSKIVASMWDSLREEAKQVYKQKTELAKREYLKQLAAYRAAKEQDEEDSQPLMYLQTKMTTASSSNKDLPPPPKLKVAPIVLKKSIQNDSPSTSNDSSANESAKTLPKLFASSGNSNSQAAPPVLVPGANTTSPTLPPPIQLRNIVPKAQGGITILQSKPGQIIKLIPASQASSITNTANGKNRIIKVTDLIRNGTANQQTTSNRESDDVQPILQTLAQETMDVTTSSVTNVKENGNGDQEEVIFLDDSDECGSHRHQSATEQTNHQNEMSVRICVRDGCENLAVSDPQWNEEYCSATCVVKHCRDVFEAWTSLQRTNIAAS